MNLPALLRGHLTLLHEGKVHNSYRLPSGKRLVYNRGSRSSNDFKLGFTILGQAETLVALDIAARDVLRQKLRQDYQDDLLAYGEGIDPDLPTALREIPQLQKQAIVVEDLDITPVESVCRYLVVLKSTAFKAYREGASNVVCGHKLPWGLKDGDVLPGAPLWTPTVKAQVGHDTPLDYKEVEETYPGFMEQSLQLFEVQRRDDLDKGIILADDKKEGEWRDGRVRWGDERGTTDSSRFILRTAYIEARKLGKPLPGFLDKQILRNHLMSVDISQFGLAEKFGIEHLDPENPEHEKFVYNLGLPAHVEEEIRAANALIVQMLTGHTLKQFQREVMGVY